jgi:hypothetical protein
LICSFKFLIFLAVCLNISTVINIKILTNSNQQTQSYKFTSHIASSIFSLCGFDHWDAWNLHTNIIWSKRSTEFKELSPCSVWHVHIWPIGKPRVSPLLSLNMMKVRNQPNSCDECTFGHSFYLFVIATILDTELEFVRYNF